MLVSLVVAASKNRVIGKDNKLPWSLPNDLKHFRDITKGHPVIMGRKTFESIGHPLPDRHNIIITRQQGFDVPMCTVVHSLAEALEVAKGDGEAEVFVIGGGEIFDMALAMADRVYYTEVDAVIDGDAYFPPFEEQEWEKVSEEKQQKDEKHAYGYAFLLYERRK